MAHFLRDFRAHRACFNRARRVCVLGFAVNQTRILVIRGGAIGDFIMTLPAIGALRAQWPDAHIEVLGYDHIVELARAPQYANATRSIVAAPLAGFFIPNNILDPDWMEYFASFNIVISYLYDPDEVFAGNLRRAGVRHLVTASPRPTDLPAAMHYVKPLESLAIYVKEPMPRVYPSESARKSAEKIVTKSPTLAVHAGSGSIKKNWDIAKFAEIARWTHEKFNADVLVICGEADDDVTKKMISMLENVPHRIIRGLKLPELAAVFERCAAFLGNDSGVTHLAAAVGAPTVAMFGPTSFSIWQPRGEKVVVVRFGGDDLAKVRAALEKFLPPS
jgi:heptosyltransferase-3